MATEKLYATIGTEVREFTEAEYAQHKKDLAKVIENAANEAKADADKQAARQAVLDKLGLTADEIAALLG